MSKETDMLRKFASGCNENDIPSFLNLHGLRDRVAFAIEAVEAQVAEAAARVAALEKRPTIVSAGSQDDDRVKPAPVRRFKVGDRIRFVAEPKWVKGYLGALGTIKRLKGDASLDYYIASDVSGTNGDHVSANDADLEPAPSAVPEPRGFRVGDRVRITKAHRCSSDWIGCEGRIVAGREDSLGDWTIGDLTKFAHLKTVPMHSQALTLVRAADAPEAPAEDAGLVERLAKVIWRLPGATGHWTDLSEPERLRFQRDAVGVLATLTAESRLCAPGEVARLRAEFYEANASAARQSRNAETLKARAEAADIRADGHAEGLRSIRKMLKQSPPDVDRAILWCDDSLSGYTQSVAATEAETNDRALAAEARAEKAEKERDALRAELSALKAKPRFRTRKVTAADARALDDEWAKSKYVGRNSWVLAMNALGFRRRVDGDS